MVRYELTWAADQDFENIFDFGIDAFGLAQALDYQNGLKQRFSKLAEHPKQCPAVDHLRMGYRRCVYNSHSIYYRIEPENVVIVRILGQQDSENAF
ncbi:type II toxin-antitoxin system RelE/ParE family toxin [Cardiobacterium sp. AH-315-I02]|nr:type II toxin-antitoxin system RelE/ParE family toxin [Cardiobacterium sp. AH-315-I02]